MNQERRNQREEGGVTRGLTERAQGRESDKAVISARAQNKVTKADILENVLF